MASIDDVTPAQVVLVFLTLCVVGTVVVAASSSAAAFGAYNRAWDGSSDLRDLVYEADADYEVGRSMAPYTTGDPTETVVFVLSPERPYSPGELATMQRFVRDGGTLVVAEDVGVNGNRILAGVGSDVRFRGALIRDEREYYRSPELPTARPANDHEYVEAVNVLTLNRGTALNVTSETVLAHTSRYAYLDANLDGVPGNNETFGSMPVATVETIGEGEVVAVGDPSIFINAMVDRPGNRAFTSALVADNTRAVVDYSHAPDVPVLAAAVLGFRESPGLQVVIGALALTGLAAVAYGFSPRRLRRQPTPVDEPTAESDLSTVDDVVSYLAARHPDWEIGRLRRVVNATARRRIRDRRE